MKSTSSFLQKRKNFSTIKKFKSVDEKSRNNVVDNDSSQRNIVSDSILFSESAVEVTSMIMSDMSEVVLLAMTERALRLNKDRKLLESRLDEKSQKSELFQLVSTEDCENLVTNESIRDIVSKDSKYAETFLELNIVLQ